MSRPSLAEHVAQVVAAAPPLTDAQRRKLAALLAPKPAGVTDGR